MYRIMLADDEGIVTNSLSFVIEKNFQGQFDIETVKSGRAAIETAEHFRPDVIFMDIQMPEMDGLTATETIRKLDRADAATVPIVAVTANAFSQDAAAARQVGMNEHITKPVKVPKLNEVLKRYLG